MSAFRRCAGGAPGASEWGKYAAANDWHRQKEKNQHTQKTAAWLRIFFAQRTSSAAERSENEEP